MDTFNADENNIVFEMAATFVNETAEHVFLTGKAGTGKTTFLRYIRQHTHKRVVVAAPTGVAAINAGGVTLHSLFQLPFEPYIPGMQTKNKFRFGKAKLDLLRQLELLIIDEVSMMRADTLDAIDQTLQGIRRNDQPFGGVQVLYIGDMFQLPPVVKEAEWSLLQPYYESAFCFHAQVVRRSPPVYLELKKVYRQREQRFVNLLNNVRNNVLTEEDFAQLNAQFLPNFAPPQSEKYITLTTHNYKADRLNQQELDKLGGETFSFVGEIKGEFPDYALPTDMHLHLKAGAQVMFIKNDTEGRYFNGKIATVSRVSRDKIYAQMPEGDEIQVLREMWKNVKYSLNKESGEVSEEEMGAYTQYPLRLAWAVTIHKSQGLTFDKAIIDIGDSFAAGQAYVALSRCTSLEGIVLRSRIAPGCILTDEYAIGYSKSEKAEAELQQILVDGKRKFWTERLLRYFEWKPMFLILWQMGKLLEDKTAEEFLPAQNLLVGFRQAARDMETVSEKFRPQLLSLIALEQQTGDMAPLRERCVKALSYFHEHAVALILRPLQDFIANFSMKRAGTFRKNIIDIEADIVLFLDNMKRLRYNNVAFADDVPLETPHRKDVFSDDKKPSPAAAARVGDGEKKPRPAKGESGRTTLTMFNEGLSIAEIAQQRGLAASTIEAHLAPFVGSEVAVEKIFTPEEIATLYPMMQPLLKEEAPAFSALFGRLGGKYSYGKLRIMYEYLKRSYAELQL
jgi:hypothetical protein